MLTVWQGPDGDLPKGGPGSRQGDTPTPPAQSPGAGKLFFLQSGYLHPKEATKFLPAISSLQDRIIFL